MPLWGKTDTENSKPKYLSSTDKAKVYFVDTTEAATDANKKKGLSVPGWVKYQEYTDANGNVRHKVEVLVAMSKTAVAAGDAADDSIVGDENFSITTQPVDVTVTAPAAASFTVVVAGTNTYQWQVKIGTANYVNVTDAGVYSGSTTATLAISDSTGLNTNKYRVVVLNQNGNTSVTSKPATLTVN